MARTTLRAKAQILEHLGLMDMLLLERAYQIQTELGIPRVMEAGASGKCLECVGFSDHAFDDPENWWPESSVMPQCDACEAFMAYVPTEELAARVVRWLSELIAIGAPVPRENWWDFWMALRRLPDDAPEWATAALVLLRAPGIDPGLPAA